MGKPIQILPVPNIYSPIHFCEYCASLFHVLQTLSIVLKTLTLITFIYSRKSEFDCAVITQVRMVKLHLIPCL